MRLIKVFLRQSRIMKMLILASGLLIFIFLIPVVFILIFSFTGNLSKPKDLPAAKKKGAALSKLTGKTVMLVGAHPDDADWYAGGTLAALHKNDNKVVVVVATSGEKGGNHKNLAKIREQEQLKAANILGYEEVKFLRFKDRELKADGKFVTKLKELIAEYRPAVIFTFDTEKEGYIYRHSDHKAAGAATLKAWKDFPSIELYFFHSSSNNAIVDVNPVQHLKVKALAVHKSQGQNRFRKVVRYIPFLRSNRAGQAGSALSFRKIAIEHGEMFRKAKD